ncbi:MAG: Rho termination factor N-terminal domain-containing protein, partial [Solirubrobacterales bacterium]
MASELEELHLADLHQRAADAGIDGYRLMRREALIEKLAGK